MREMGTHLLMDLLFPAGELETRDIGRWQHDLAVIASEMGLKTMGFIYHHFDSPGALTVVVLLASSHTSVHTWPEHQSAAVDLYHCGDRGLTYEDAVVIGKKLGATCTKAVLVSRDRPEVSR